MTMVRPAGVAVLVAAVASMLAAQSYFQPPVWQQFTPGLVSSYPTPLVADVNGDGRPDIIMGNDGGGQLICFLALGGGVFTGPIVSVVGPSAQDSPRPLAAHDLDGDGNMDIVAFTWQGIRTLLGAGNGSFTPMLVVPGTVGGSDESYDVADLDNDGFPELIGLGFGTAPSVTIWKWLGGGWVPTLTTPLSQLAGFVNAGDFNGDGWTDIALLMSSIGVQQVYVMVNGGLGQSFTLQGPFFHGLGTMSGEAADIDGDGCDDLVTTLAIFLTISLGDPQSILQPSTQVNLGNAWNGLTYFGHRPQLVDCDGDGLRDLFYVDQPPTPPSPVTTTLFGKLFPSRGNGAFSMVPMITGYGSNLTGWGSIRADDLDGDGDPDLVIFRDRPDLPGAPTELGIAWNEAIVGPGATGGAGPPMMSVGMAALGNASFTVSLSGGLPTSTAALGISLGTGMLGTPGSAIWLDLTPGQLLFPSGALGVFLTDASGSATAPLPIPNDPGAQGATFYAQWAVLDPAGAFTLLPGSPLALSEARKIILWP